jgi:putative hemolysin
VFAETEVVNPHWAVIVAGVLAVPLLVAVNGFFVAAEFALVAVRKTRIEELVRSGVKRAVAVHDAIVNLDRSIAATQLGITLASIALGWVGEAVVEILLEPLFSHLPNRIAFVSRHSLAIAVAFCFVTFMHVVFGELIPKAIALQTPERTSLAISTPLNLFSRFARPVIWFLNGTGNWLLRRIGFTPSGESDEVHTVEELRLIVEDTQEAGLLDSEQADFLRNVFALSDKTVIDCMVPKDKMTGLDVRAKRDEILAVVRDSGHTRLPVWEDTPDNIIGVVNTKELVFLFMGNNPLFVLDDMLYPATFFLPTVSVADALRTFKKTHKPMGVVRDADRNVLGLITLEDVIEQIVGDIEDEHDVKVSKLVRRLPPRRGMRGRPA